MSLKDIFNKLKKEAQVLQGDETKDKQYCSSHSYPDANMAQNAFERAKRKLFDVNRWSDMQGINSTFELFDERGRRSAANEPKIGYYIRIILPAPAPENWVRVNSISVKENMAEFVVNPSEQPSERKEEDPFIEHFFIKEASSTFRVELHENEIIGCEIGRNEGINNQDDEAGDRALINTLIAEGGWAGFQGLQWEKLMDFIVHHEEAESTD